jgi:hypothetical protein
MMSSDNVNVLNAVRLKIINNNINMILVLFLLLTKTLHYFAFDFDRT